MTLIDNFEDFDNFVNFDDLDVFDDSGDKELLDNLGLLQGDWK